MGKVVKLKLINGIRRGRINTNRVLRAAINAKLAKAVIIGEQDDGRIYMASTEGPESALWDIEFAKMWLLSGCPEQDLGD